MARTASHLILLVLALAISVVPPALADDYPVYHEGGTPASTSLWIWCGEDPSEQGLCPFFSEQSNQCDNPEGSRHLNVPSNTWAGFGIFYTDDQLPPQNTRIVDLSEFANGDIRYSARSALHDFETGFQCWEGNVVKLSDGTTPWGNILRCKGGTSAELPCATNDDCPSSECVGPVVGHTLFNILGGDFGVHDGYGALRCQGGANADAPCATGGDCASGICDNGPFGDWQDVVVPVADIYNTTGGLSCNGGTNAGAPCTTGGECNSGVCDDANFVSCLENVSASFLSTGAGSPTLYQVDNIRWRSPQDPAFHTGASTVTVSGRQLLVDGEPFVVNGVAYTPISIGENYTGAFRNRNDLYPHDFASMAAMGVNTVRIYSSFLTTSMLNAAAANGLYVIPTFEVDTTQLDCAEGRAYMQERLEEKINEWKNHPALLLWLLGNEVEAGQSQTDLCNTGTCTVSAAACTVSGDCSSGTCSFPPFGTCSVDTDCPNSGSGEICIPETCRWGWYPQLDALATAAAAVDSSHPSGVANADIGNIGFAGCSDDGALPDLDLWGMNLYRGCTLQTAVEDFGAISNKPLIITEFGSDAWDGSPGFEDQTMQANCVASLLGQASAKLAVRDPGNKFSAGQILFSWMDEWWKDFDNPPTCDNTYWDKHDTCAAWQNGAYPDPNMNEEWWGLATRQMYCTNGTTPCSRDVDCGPGQPGSCAVTTGQTCRLDSECPGFCSITTTRACTVTEDCPGKCNLNQATCDSDTDCPGQQVCIKGLERCDYETCNQQACNVVLDESVRVGRSAYGSASEAYRLGAVGDLKVASHDTTTGSTDITFAPASGSADHTLYCGPLSAVSTYGYTSSEAGVGASGSATVTLSGGSQFCVLVGKNLTEGCYGWPSSCATERPPFAGATQSVHRNCPCP